MTAHSCPTGRHPEPAYGCYTWHACRCAGCTEENRRYCTERQRLVARRNPHRLVPSEPTRARLLMLRDMGASSHWIAEQTGLHRSTVRHQWRGRSPKVRAVVALRVEALARAVGRGDLHPPGIRSSTPDRPCLQCGCRERNGHHRLCRTCQRERVVAA